MNCEDFNLTAADLAGAQLMDAAQREEANTHANSCARCASRLADEQALTGGLRFLAKGADEQAPDRVQTAVLAAFRRERASVPAVARVRSSRQKLIYVAASAAAVALIVVLVALMAARARNSQQTDAQKAANPGPAVPHESRPAIPQTVSPAPENQVAVQQHRPAKRVRNAGTPRHQAGRTDRTVSDSEIATEFIPLMNRETIAQMDGGQVMRVELPRSALMAFGLPMDMERATERIKADVVVGNDGLARAIRFVR